MTYASSAQQSSTQLKQLQTYANHQKDSPAVNITDPTYFLLYFALAISAIFNSFNGNRSLKFISYCVTTFLIAAFVAFRWKIGTDWDAYYDFFKGISSGVGSTDQEHFDLGFTFINYIASFISDSYTFFLICTTLLSTGLVSYILYKFSKNPHIGQLIFLGTYLPIHFIGSIRRSIAMAFVFACLIMTVEVKSKISSILSLGFAFLQHKTAAIGLLIYIIPKHRFSVRTTSLIVLTTWALGSIGISEILLEILAKIVAGHQESGLLMTIANYAGENYKEYAPEGVNPILLSTLSMAKKIFYLLFFNLALKRKSSELDDVMYNIYVVGIGLYALFIGAMIVQVVAIYFLFFEVLLVSRSFSKLRPIEQGLLLFYILLGSFLSFDSGLSVYPELFYPYKSIFSL